MPWWESGKSTYRREGMIIEDSKPKQGSCYLSCRNMRATGCRVSGQVLNPYTELSAISLLPGGRAWQPDTRGWALWEPWGRRRACQEHNHLRIRREALPRHSDLWCHLSSSCQRQGFCPEFLHCKKYPWEMYLAIRKSHKGHFWRIS